MSLFNGISTKRRTSLRGDVIDDSAIIAVPSFLKNSGGKLRFFDSLDEVKYFHLPLANDLFARKQLTAAKRKKAHRLQL